jgi:hypothetical protein
MSDRTTMTYSPTADAFALSFNPAPRGKRLTRELLPGFRVDFVGDVVVGIEILDASALLPAAALATIGTPPVVMLSLAEAGREFKRHPRTLRHAAERGKIDGAVKDGRDWRVPRLGVLNYIANLPPAGRPPKNRRAPNRRRVKSEA